MALPGRVPPLSRAAQRTDANLSQELAKNEILMKDILTQQQDVKVRGPTRATKRTSLQAGITLA